MTPRHLLDQRKIDTRILGCTSSFANRSFWLIYFLVLLIHIHLVAFAAKHPTRGTLKLSAFLPILSDPRVQDIPLILETPSFEAVEVWECEIKVLNALSEVGAGSGADVGEEGDAERQQVLKDMVGDIRSVVQEYCHHKEKVGKKGALGRGNSKTRVNTRRRKTTDAEEEDEASGSDDARSE